MGVGGELLLSVLAVELRLGRDMSWEAIMWALIWSNGRKAAIVARVNHLFVEMLSPPGTRQDWTSLSGQNRTSTPANLWLR